MASHVSTGGPIVIKANRAGTFSGSVVWAGAFAGKTTRRGTFAGAVQFTGAFAGTAPSVNPPTAPPAGAIYAASASRRGARGRPSPRYRTP